MTQPKLYCVGHNLPGYMPDQDTPTPEQRWEDAKAALLWQIEIGAEETSSDPETQDAWGEMEKDIQKLRKGEEYSDHGPDGRIYWLTQA